MEEWKSRKLLNYLPPPIAKQSKSPLIKKEFSPVHLKHCRETSDNHLTFITHGVSLFYLHQFIFPGSIIHHNSDPFLQSYHPVILHFKRFKIYFLH